MHCVCWNFLLLSILPLHLLYDIHNFVLRASSSAPVSSLVTLLRHPRFPKVVCRVEIQLSFSKSDAADCEDSIVTIDEPCAAVTWPKLL
ncbi:hypothetical protein TNCV_666991 [Trichonephila clavipes]|nr:hypothetical protein TNCV_666991 [Trichonephila clavipes]